MKYVIAGFGKFGEIALKRLRAMNNQAQAVIVDSDCDKSSGVKDCSIICGDAIDIISDLKLDPADIIIPMIPVHLAAEFTISQNPGLKFTALPLELQTQLPNPFKLDEANLVCTKAEFMCPDDCPEGETCTITGQYRCPLYEELNEIKVADWDIVVLRSFQIAPGIGGYSFGDLKYILNRIVAEKSLIITSCKCHAFISALAKM